MKQNVGQTDRIVRLLMALVIISLGIGFKSWLGALAIIPLATAVVGWCPLYLPFGLSTCARKQS